MHRIQRDHIFLQFMQWSVPELHAGCVQIDLHKAFVCHHSCDGPASLSYMPRSSRSICKASLPAYSAPIARQTATSGASGAIATPVKELSGDGPKCTSNT